ncbi:GGDEF domain-containing protein [Vibrio sp. JC009]|uniref:sensor domain-containing diguanylate cyclase n=1 Tax=Vibrio sp. JC009 TaxID=2912314 RepID=UPI0023B0ED69|nr:GGDEF domain-containing protein [Vibrio sp. JC009]WED23910.1 GGDEF domain-containing protein [Vibrio sp. JC009]
MSDTKQLQKHKQFNVTPIGVTGRIATLLTVTVIIPMLVTGILIENGKLAPGESHYLAIPIVILFILVPVSRFIARYTINKDLATINQFCDEIKNGNYDVSFELKNQKENEDEFIQLLRNLTWMSHNLTSSSRKNKQEIKEAKQNLSDMEKLAFTDPLTGLYNRRYLNYLDNEFFNQSPEDQDSMGHASLIYIDCDKFKQINDTKGHIFGDKLLVGLAQCLNNACRQEQDTAFRMGGDEFAVLLPDTTSEQAVVVGNRICAMYQELDFTEGTSLSVGIASVNCIRQHCNNSLHKLIDFADQQAYHAKRSGGGAIRIM